MQSYRISQQQTKYPLVITDGNGKNLIIIKNDGQVEFASTPNEASRLFWNTFSNIFSDAVKAHVDGKLQTFNDDIKASLTNEQT